jgi:ketosteroid isomerase-like protein
VWKGIYALDGDTLRTCDNAPELDKSRPAAFEAKAGSGYILITFRRAKPRDAAGDVRALTQLIKDLNGAIVKADIAFLERVLHEDFTHHRPRGTVENRTQYLENRKARRVDFQALVADEIKVRVYGDTAVVTYRSTAKGKDQQGAIDEQRRWTRVFVRHEGRWQLVHSQGTTIQKP